MNKPDIPGKVEPAQPSKPPMTQAECEAYIMLKGQSGDAVFEIHLVDKEVDQDPTMRGLMAAVSLMIHQGIMGMPFQEAEAARTKPKPIIRGV